MDNNLELINKKIEELEQKIEEIVHASDKDYQKRKNELYQLSEECYELQRKKLFYQSPIIASSEIIDLRNCGGIKNLIVLHDTEIIVGKIEYRGYHISEYLGDVGYHIEDEYQNKGYATEALRLLTEKLSEENIPDFWISTHNNNIASIKVIEKNNGELISNRDNVLLYCCQTTLKKNNKKS